jgi:putative ABC transport system permease protein
MLHVAMLHVAMSTSPLPIRFVSASLRVRLNMRHDLRQAARLLLHSRGVTTIVCLSLALGIGVNAVLFSLVDAALLRPMPYRDPERLVNVYRTAVSVDGERLPGTVISGPLVDVIRGFSNVFEDVQVFRVGRPVALAAGLDDVIRLGGFAPGVPAFLGISPRLGRGFTDADVNAGDTLIVSDGFWQRRFQRSPNVLGQRVQLPDRTYVVIGVMPPAFRHFAGVQTDAWYAIGDHDGTNLAARLRAGLTIAEAQRHVDELARRLPSPRIPLELQILPADWTRASSLPPDFVVRSPRILLLTLMGAAACVLLISCANIANLLLARAAGRQREIAVRAAIGATRARLVRQFLTEAILLAAVSGAMAVAVAKLGILALPKLIPAQLAPSLLDFSLPQLDFRVLGFGAIVTLIAGCLSGIVPAMRGSRSPTFDGLLTGGGRVIGWRTQRRLRNIFQAAQVALTVMLLVGAGLLVHSFLRALNIPQGFDSRHLVYAELSFPRGSFPLPAQRAAFADDLMARLPMLPGVRAAAVGPPPVDGAVLLERLATEGQPASAAAVRVSLFYIGHDYFSVAGIALLAGRTCGVEDRQDTPRVAVISAKLASRLSLRPNSVGSRLVSSDGRESYAVIGMVPEIRTVDFAKSDGELFLCASQSSRPPGLVMRMDSVSPGLAESIRDLSRSVDARVTVGRIGTVEQRFAEADPLGSVRFFAILLTTLSGLGMATASVGLYGLMALTVKQRRRELAVRIALGAPPESVRRLVARDAAISVISGTAAGLIGAAWASRVVASRVFHLAADDPAAIAATVVLLLGIWSVSILVPASRAGRLDAVKPLRDEE